PVTLVAGYPQTVVGPVTPEERQARIARFQNRNGPAWRVIVGPYGFVDMACTSDPALVDQSVPRIAGLVPTLLSDTQLAGITAWIRANADLFGLSDPALLSLDPIERHIGGDLSSRTGLARQPLGDAGQADTADEAAPWQARGIEAFKSIPHRGIDFPLFSTERDHPVSICVSGHWWPAARLAEMPRV